MIIRICVVLLILLTHLCARSSQTEKETRIKDIPAGFMVISETTGDFNGDGFTDVAQVIEKSSNDHEEIRRLRIFTGNADGSFTKILDNSKAIIGSMIGRMDSFEGIKIKKNSLYIDYYWGGGDWTVYQFIYRNGGFYLAGMEAGLDEFTVTSINFLSKKKLHRTKINGKLEETWSKLENYSRIHLKDFDAMESGY